MKKQKGFSIGEVMVAMFILLVGIVDAIFLTVRSVGSLKDSREAVVATLLAQEGTELVRNVRDNNVTQSTCGVGDDERCLAFDVDYGFPSKGNVPVRCSADYTLNGDGVLNCSNPKDLLYVDKERMLYSHSSGGSWVETRYERGIYIDYDYTIDKNDGDDNDQVAIVTSVVMYGDNPLPGASEIDDISQICRLDQKCAYAQTRLTSWINYGD